MSESTHRAPAAGDANPYAPTTAGSVAAPAIKRVRVLPVNSPGGRSPCSYFTFDEFASLFTDKLVEACRPFGIEAVVGGQNGQGQEVDSTIRCGVQSITHFRRISWLWFLRWVPLPVGYTYYPASFVVSGTIESQHHQTIPFSVRRTFEKGRLGEKANMVIGMGSEATRIISMAAKALEKAYPVSTGGAFWAFVLLVPFTAAALASMAVYFGWDLVCEWMPTIGDRQSPTRSNQHVDAAVHAGLVFAIVGPMVLALAPQWVYENRRAGFAYRFASTSRSIVLRVWFAVLALPPAILLGLSLLP